MYSQTVPVHIQVLDVNNYDPYFEQQSYNVEMEVGKFYKKIIQLKAIDKDCSYDYSSICSYTFIRDQTFEKHDNNSVHNIFEINSDGVVRNIKPVIYDIGKSIILKIIAEDCGGRKSKPVLLIVKILPNNTCSNSWTYLSNKKFYTPLNEIMEIVPDARLHICQIQDCEISEHITTVSLDSLADENAAKGCDRGENIDIVHGNILRRKILYCATRANGSFTQVFRSNYITDLMEIGLSIQSFDGLTHYLDVNSSGTIEYVTNSDSELLIDKPAHHSNGLNTNIEPIMGFGINFSFLFWMKHDSNMESKKEHIFCRSDDHSLNRHHLAVFVKNCKLVLLIRQEEYLALHHEYLEGLDRKKLFSPSEVRWKLPEVCDSRWHHYVINVKFPNDFELILDGKMFKPNKNPFYSNRINVDFDSHNNNNVIKTAREIENPQIVDDWPLHSESHRFFDDLRKIEGKNVKVRTVVGACWEGKRGRMDKHYKGFLSELVLIKGSTIDRETVADCLLDCNEGLSMKNYEEPRMNGVEHIDRENYDRTTTNNPDYEWNGENKDKISETLTIRAWDKYEMEKKVRAVRFGYSYKPFWNDLISNDAYIMRPVPGIRRVTFKTITVCRKNGTDPKFDLETSLTEFTPFDVEIDVADFAKLHEISAKVITDNQGDLVSLQKNKRNDLVVQINDIKPSVNLWLDSSENVENLYNNNEIKISHNDVKLILQREGDDSTGMKIADDETVNINRIEDGHNDKYIGSKEDIHQKDGKVDANINTDAIETVSYMSDVTNNGVKLFSHVTLAPIPSIKENVNIYYRKPVSIENTFKVAKCQISTLLKAYSPFEQGFFMLPADLISSFGLEFEKITGNNPNVYQRLNRKLVKDGKDRVKTVLIRNDNTIKAYAKVIKELRYFLPPIIDHNVSMFQSSRLDLTLKCFYNMAKNDNKSNIKVDPQLATNELSIQLFIKPDLSRLVHIGKTRKNLTNKEHNEEISNKSSSIKRIIPSKLSRSIQIVGGDLSLPRAYSLMSQPLSENDDNIIRNPQINLITIGSGFCVAVVLLALLTHVALKHRRSGSYLNVRNFDENEGLHGNTFKGKCEKNFSDFGDRSEYGHLNKYDVEKGDTSNLSKLLRAAPVSFIKRAFKNSNASYYSGLDKDGARERNHMIGDSSTKNYQPLNSLPYPKSSIITADPSHRTTRKEFFLAGFTKLITLGKRASKTAEELDWDDSSFPRLQVTVNPLCNDSSFESVPLGNDNQNTPRSETKFDSYTTLSPASDLSSKLNSSNSNNKKVITDECENDFDDFDIESDCSSPSVISKSCCSHDSCDECEPDRKESKCYPLSNQNVDIDDGDKSNHDNLNQNSFPLSTHKLNGDTKKLQLNGQKFKHFLTQRVKRMLDTDPNNVNHKTNVNLTKLSSSNMHQSCPNGETLFDSLTNKNTVRNFKNFSYSPNTDIINYSPENGENKEYLTNKKNNLSLDTGLEWDDSM
ncbi:uncharacterized protein LOC135925356 [Gordionus sp. m RMFG-2023]|uniref:uncharacterized protein LOC135925356 n=1 Tax=Gordionus sp. m RMFG-2023 TaxID=3053472 RepID=UPI0031FD75FE